MYAGVWNGNAEVVATISDGSSAPVRLDFGCQTGTQNLDVLVHVKNAKGSTLTVTHTLTASFNSFGNVPLQAAAVHQYTDDDIANVDDSSSSSSSNDVVGLLFQGAVISTL